MFVFNLDHENIFDVKIKYTVDEKPFNIKTKS